MRVHGFFPVEIVQPDIEDGLDAITALALFALEAATVMLRGRSRILVKWRCEYCMVEIVEPFWTVFKRARKAATCSVGRKVGFMEAFRARWKNPLLSPEYDCLSSMEKKIGMHRMIAELLMGGKFSRGGPR